MGNILIGFLGRKAELAAASARSSAPEIAERPRKTAGQALNVNVIFTSAEPTVSAMRQAAQLASDLGAKVRVLAPTVVDFHTELDHPPVNPEFLAAQYRAIAEEAGVETSIQIVLCRDVVDGLKTILRPNSLVVVGGEKALVEVYWADSREQACSRAGSCWTSSFVRYEGEYDMLDLFYIVITVLFFVLAWAFTKACDRL